VIVSIKSNRISISVDRELNLDGNVYGLVGYIAADSSSSNIEYKRPSEISSPENENVLMAVYKKASDTAPLRPLSVNPVSAPIQLLMQTSLRDIVERKTQQRILEPQPEEEAAAEEEVAAAEEEVTPQVPTPEEVQPQVPAPEQVTAPEIPTPEEVQPQVPTPEEVPVTPEEVPVTPEQVPVTPEQVQPQVPVTDEPSLEDYDRLIRFLDKMLKM